MSTILANDAKIGKWKKADPESALLISSLSADITTPELEIKTKRATIPEMK